MLTRKIAEDWSLQTVVTGPPLGKLPYMRVFAHKPRQTSPQKDLPSLTCQTRCHRQCTWPGSKGAIACTGPGGLVGEPDQKLLHARHACPFSWRHVEEQSSTQVRNLRSVLMSSPPAPTLGHCVHFSQAPSPLTSQLWTVGKTPPACIQLNFIEILISFCFFIKSPCGLLLLTLVLCFWN